MNDLDSHNQGQPETIPEGMNESLGSFITKKLKHENNINDSKTLVKVANELKKLVLSRTHEALKKFYQTDYCLIENKMNERTICCRLAIYLHELFHDFTGYYADAEYYRSTVPSDEITDKRSQRILCDLLLHSRRQYDDSVDNLLAIEVKLFDSGDKVDSDLHRLCDFALPKMPNTPDDAIHDTLVTLFIRMKETGYQIYEIKPQKFKNMRKLNNRKLDGSTENNK